MGSRIRKGKVLFELVAEIVRPSDTSSTEPNVAFRYPYANDDEDLLKNMLKFVFPFDGDFESPAVDQFTFVLTDIDGKFKFGFCRLSAGSHTCLCLISCFPWFEVFYKLLNVLVEIRNQNNAEATLVSLLDSLFSLDPSTPGAQLEASSIDKHQTFTFVCPDPNQLPSIPNSRNLTEYYCAIDTYNMMFLFSSMLRERRILVTSRKLSRLTACVHGAAALLFPLHWQHIYIPILPKHLLDYCSAPMPYLIGVHSSLWKCIRKEELGDVIILDADDNNVICQFDDLSIMPHDVISRLKKQLKVQRPGKTTSLRPSMVMGDAISKAFLQALVALFGGYRDALKFRDGKIMFDSEEFLKSRPIGMQEYLQSSLQVQIFAQFITERLELLNSSQGFTDPFESEINSMGGLHSRSGSKKNKNWDKADKKLQNITSKVKNRSMKALKSVRTKFVDDYWNKIDMVDSCSSSPALPYQQTDAHQRPRMIHQTYSEPNHSNQPESPLLNSDEHKRGRRATEAIITKKKKVPTATLR